MDVERRWALHPHHHPRKTADGLEVPIGKRRIFMIVWIFLNALVLALGAVHYSLHDNLVTANTLFGSGFGKDRPGGPPFT
jgi:hypothetical protein